METNVNELDQSPFDQTDVKFYEWGDDVVVSLTIKEGNQRKRYDVLFVDFDAFFDWHGMYAYACLNVFVYEPNETQVPTSKLTEISNPVPGFNRFMFKEALNEILKRRN